MIVQAEHDVLAADLGRPCGGLAALARAVASAAQATSLEAALEALVEAAVGVSGADVAVVRVCAAGSERFEAVAVAGPAGLAAELEGTFVPADEMPRQQVDLLDDAPAAVVRAASACRLDGRAARSRRGRRGLGDARGLSRRRSLHTGGAPRGRARRVLRGTRPPCLRSRRPQGRRRARAAGARARRRSARRGARRVPDRRRAGPRRGDDRRCARRRSSGKPAMAASSSLPRTASVTAPTSSRRGIWRRRRSTSAAPSEPSSRSGCRQRAASRRRCRSDSRPSAYCNSSSRRPTRRTRCRSRDSRPSACASRMRCARARRRAPSASSSRRTRALLAVVGQATAELSLAHTLETAVDRLSELFAVEHVAVYLRAPDNRLTPAAGRGLAGPHARVAERLLEIALGTGRGRPVVEVADAWTDDRAA